MKEYDYKVKNKKLIFNILIVISIFIIAQIGGVMFAYKFFSNNLIMTILSIVFINIIGYIIVLK